MNDLITKARAIPTPQPQPTLTINPVTLPAPGRGRPLELRITAPISVTWGDGSSDLLPWPATSRTAPRLRHVYAQRADVSVQVQLGMLIASQPVALVGCPVPPQQLLNNRDGGGGTSRAGGGVQGDPPP